jgi:hypothetical protein
VPVYARRLPMLFQPAAVTATARAETMLALAEPIGIDLDLLEAARRRLEEHGRMLDAADGPARRAAVKILMEFDVAELARAYKLLARAVEQGGEA